jgi:hypothetical protein
MIMRRVASLFALVITAVLIPGGARAQVTSAQSVSSRSLVSSPVNRAATTLDLRTLRNIRSLRDLRNLSEARQIRVIRSVRHSPFRSFGMAIGWLLLVTLVGFVLMAFGADKLDIVIHTMQRGIGKSLATGFLGQLAIVPGAIAVVCLLAVTLIGIVLIPLGLMAFMFVVSGIAMFGFIAVATMTGAALSGGKTRDETPHGRMLRAFLTGSAVYMGMWLVTAALSGVPLLGVMLESFSSAVTFIAVTTGFGAVLLSYWRGEFKTPGTLPAG